MGSNVVMGLEPHKGEQMMKFSFWGELYFLRQLKSDVRGSGFNTENVYF